jgi:hypothetical protein
MNPDDQTHLLAFIDSLAAVVPATVEWPAKLRSDYEWAVRLLEQRAAIVKPRKHASHH